MPTYLQRYLEGEQMQVWSELLTLGASIADDRLLYLDVKSVANETMDRVKHNVELIVRRLDEKDYWFSSYRHRAYRPPSHILITFLDSFEQKYGLLPISLRAWYEIVGEVNLTGAHPAWKVCTDVYTCDKLMLAGTFLNSNIEDIINYSEDDIDLATWLGEFSRATIIDEARYPERISRIVQIATNSELSKDARFQQLQKYLASVTPLREAILAPLRRLPPFFRFSSDHRQIAEPNPIYIVRPYHSPRPLYPNWIDYGSGRAYEQDTLLAEIGMTSYGDEVYINMGKPAADSYLMGLPDYKTHSAQTFIQYLRRSFEWGGFPGFANLDESLRPTEMLEYLKEGLLPI